MRLRLWLKRDKNRSGGQVKLRARVRECLSDRVVGKEERVILSMTEVEIVGR